MNAWRGVALMYDAPKIKLPRGFLTDKKVMKIIHAAEHIRDVPTVEADALGFMGASLVQMTLPPRDVGNLTSWGRTNGNKKLVIQPFIYPSDDNPELQVSVGIPYGTIPRLLLIWVSTEVAKHKSRELELGQSMAEFMRFLDLDPQRGGKRSDARALQEQIKRLFWSRIAIFDTSSTKFGSGVSMELADEREFWWNADKPMQDKLFTSRIVLSEKFFNMLTESPVPLDMRAVKALRQSPLALDLYAWLTYRVSYLQGQQVIPWGLLHHQFGNDYARCRDFRLKVRDLLRRIQWLYPELRLDADDQRGLVLFESPPHVRRKYFSVGKPK